MNAWDGLTDANMLEMVKFRNAQRSRLGILTYNTAHESEEYGFAMVRSRFDAERPPAAWPFSSPRGTRVRTSQRVPLRWSRLQFRRIEAGCIQQRIPIDGFRGRNVSIFLRRNGLEIQQASVRIQFEIDHAGERRGWIGHADHSRSKQHVMKIGCHHELRTLPVKKVKHRRLRGQDLIPVRMRLVIFLDVIYEIGIVVEVECRIGGPAFVSEPGNQFASFLAKHLGRLIEPDLLPI